MTFKLEDFKPLCSDFFSSFLFFWKPRWLCSWQEHLSPSCKIIQCFFSLLERQMSVHWGFPKGFGSRLQMKRNGNFNTGAIHWNAAWKQIAVRCWTEPLWWVQIQRSTRRSWKAQMWTSRSLPFDFPPCSPADWWWWCQHNWFLLHTVQSAERHRWIYFYPIRTDAAGRFQWQGSVYRDNNVQTSYRGPWRLHSAGREAARPSPAGPFWRCRDRLWPNSAPWSPGRWKRVWHLAQSWRATFI